MHPTHLAFSRRLFLGGGVAGLAAIWAPRAFAQANPKELVVAAGTDITNFSPIRFGGGNGNVINQLYDPIVYMDNAGVPQPAIAESWERGADGLSITLKLRDAVFHSGRKISAEDIRYTVTKYQDPALGGNMTELGVTTVDVIDDKTARINFSRKIPGIFGVLSATYVLDPQRFDQNATQDAGSGPFVAANWQPGVSISLKRFPQHWANDKVTLDQISVRIIADDAALAASLQTGAVDLVLGAGTLALELMKDVPGTHIQWITAAPRTHYLTVNCSRPPFDNKLVRQAIAAAIDRQKILEISFRDRGEASCQPWGSTHWAHAPEVERLSSFDLEKAKHLMAQSGVKPFATSVNTSTDAYSPGSVATAQILQQDFQKIGVTLDIRTFEPARARALIISSDFDSVLHSYTEGGNDPQFIIPSALYGPNGRSKFTSPELEALVAKAADATELADRKAIYKQISEVVVDTAYIMPLVHEAKPAPMRDGIEGFDVDHTGIAVLYPIRKTA